MEWYLVVPSAFTRVTLNLFLKLARQGILQISQ